MKFKLLLFLLIIPLQIYSKQTYVPDDSFELALIKLGFDSLPLNDSVPTKNIDTVTVLFLNYQSISDLTGIEDFTSLIILVCNNNNLTQLDVTQNNNLKSIDCSNNKLSKLNLPQTSNFKFLECANNQISNLDLTKTPSLISLDCSFNQIIELDVSNNFDLELFYCIKNKLANLDISKNSKLTQLSCLENNLTSLDLSRNSNLLYITCSNNRLTNLDLSYNLLLQELFCTNNKLISLDLSNNPKLMLIYCDSNDLQSIDVKNGNNKIYIQSDLIHFNFEFNPELRCIQVDDSVFSNTNKLWKKDPIAHYSENCGFTGLDETKLEFSKLSISPNPVSDQLTINTNKESNNIEIFSVEGIKVYQSSVNFQTSDNSIHIDVSGLLPGLYFVKVGNLVERFVKL